MSTVLKALKQIQGLIEPLYRSLRSHDIQCYEPEPFIGEPPVIQCWQPHDEAYVVGITTTPPGDTTYDKQTGIIRSYTRTLHEDNVGHLERLKEKHISDEFLGNILRFTTSPVYDTPNLPRYKVHMNTPRKRATLEDRLKDRNKA